MEEAKYDFVLAGKISDPLFHKCLASLQHIEREHPKSVTLTVHQFFETQWEEYLHKLQVEKKGPFFNHKSSSPLVFFNDNVYIGDGETFLEWALNEFRYSDSANLIYKKRATDAQKQIIENTPGRNYVYLDVNINGAVQKVVIELFTEYAPKTCSNFMKLCSGELTNASGEKVSYIGTEFHRIVKGMYVQGGDIHKHGAAQKGGASSFEGEFADESFHVKHAEVGLVGMCKRKSYAHSNECQFYVTTSAPLSFLDTKYVVFGRVISGMRAFKIMQKLEIVNEKPVQSVKIVAAGEYKISAGKKGGSAASAKPE
jgi:cyclophilin family peptidyl-prolyl cis-trans isomerase